MFGLFVRLYGGAEGHAEELEERAYEVLGMLKSREAPRECATPAWLTAVEDQLYADPCQPVSVRRLASELEVHPVYLARAFRRRFGCRISEYAQRLRAQHAAHLLAQTGLPLASLAVDAGFADQPHLCRVFKTHFGITPGRYRQMLRN
jgi:AraC family transcriptional regulator